MMNPVDFMKKVMIFRISGQLAMASFITRHSECSSANPEIHTTRHSEQINLGGEL